MKKFHAPEWSEPQPGAPLLRHHITIVDAQVYNTMYRVYQERPVIEADGKYYIIRNLRNMDSLNEEIEDCIRARDVYIVQPVSRIKYLKRAST